MFHETLTAKTALGAAFLMMVTQGAAADANRFVLVHAPDCPQQVCQIDGQTLSGAEIATRGLALDQNGFGVIHVADAGVAGEDGFRERMKGFWTVGAFR